MAEDGVALALVGVGARLSDLRESGLDDEMAELLLRLLEAVHADDATRAARVAALAAKEKNVWFIGRLANYRYFNMDQVVEKALELVETELSALN